jgi:hypothetical protein
LGTAHVSPVISAKGDANLAKKESHGTYNGCMHPIVFEVVESNDGATKHRRSATESTLRARIGTT